MHKLMDCGAFICTQYRATKANKKIVQNLTHLVHSYLKAITVSDFLFPSKSSELPISLAFVILMNI